MSPEATDATARRLLLRHPPGVTPDDSQALRAALEQAAHAQQELAARHPAIVPVGSLAVDAEGYWLEESADGRNLEAVLAEDAPLDERRVASLGVQLCDALRKACYPPDSHPRPHGALRPACVRLAGNRLQLSDLGIAAALIDVLGSAAPREELDLLAPYVARELWLQAGALGELRDMFAVGVILYELATGKHPYGVDRRDYNDCEQRILTAEPNPVQESRPELSDSFSGIIDRAVARREEDRFPSLGQLRDALLPLAGATALELTAAVPPEAGTLDLREGAAQADAAGVATLLTRFATAVIERSGLLAAENLGVELADLRWHDNAHGCTAAARITCPPILTDAVMADIAIRKTDTALRIDDPAASQRALLDAVQATVLAAQRAALDRVIRPLKDGPFPAARSTTDLEQAVPATLLTVACLPEPQPATIELSLVWNAARATWDERDAGGLAAAAVDVAREAALAATQHRVRRVADVLMANEPALRWTVAAPPPADGLPASIPLTIRLDWQPDAEAGQTLVEFTLTYPIADEQTLDRHLRRAERELGKLQTAAPAASTAAGRSRFAALAAPLAGVTLVALVLVAWIAWPRDPQPRGTATGGPSAQREGDAQPAQRGNHTANTNGEPGNASDPDGDTPAPEPNVASGLAAAERERIAALRADFDAHAQRARDQLAGSVNLAAANNLLVGVLDRFEPDRADLTPAQQDQLAALRDSLDALETLRQRIDSARENPSPGTLADVANALPAATAGPEGTPADVDAGVNELVRALDLAATRGEAGDAWGLGHFLRRARRAADMLAQTAGLAAPLPELLSRFRQERAVERLRALEPAIAQAEAWLGEHGDAPADPAEQFRQTATAGQARAQLDALGLYLPREVLDSLGFGIPGDSATRSEIAGPAGTMDTLDGVLRWEDLEESRQRTIQRLLAWSLVTLAVTPAGAGEPIRIPLSCLADDDGPNGAAVWMGRTEVTVDQYRRVLGTLPNPDAGMAARGDHPVGYVTLDRTQAFCAALTAAAAIDELVIRLPYAPEWERACLAGRGALLDAMPDLRRYDAESGTLTVAIERANFHSRELDARFTPHADGFAEFAPVGSYAPNAWQFDDMLGNVLELVKIDPSTLEGRGGGFEWVVDPSEQAGDTFDPFQRNSQADGLRPQKDVGFRIVIEWL